MANRIQLRRGTAAQWAEANPVLGQGEPGVESDTGKLKIGNGLTAWADLVYASQGPQGPAGVADDASVAALAADPESETAGVLSATFEPRKTWASLKVLALGDSIFYGEGASARLTTSAIAQLEAAVEALLPGTSVTITNAGQSGDTTSGMLNRLPALLAAQKYDVVLLQKSINDARADLGWATPSLSDSNVRQMVTMVQFSGAVPVVVTSAPINPATYNNLAIYDLSSVVEARQSNALIRTAASDLKARIADTYQAFSGDFQYGGLFDLADGIHPNDIGHDGWTTTLARAIAGLPYTSVATTPNPYATLVSDSFTRGDTTAGLGTADTGQAWTSTTDWGVIGGKAYAVTPADGELVTLNAGQSDMEASVTASNPGGVQVASVVARATDDNNHYLADILVTANATSGAMRVYKRVAGTYTVLVGPVTVNGLTANAPVTLSLAVRGGSLLVSVNGVPIRQLADSSLTTGTRAGIRQAAAHALRFDDFRVTS